MTSSKRKLVIEFIVKEVTKRYLGRKFTFCIILKFIDIRKKILVQNLDKGPLQNINFTLRLIHFELGEISLQSLLIPAPVLTTKAESGGGA